MRQRKQKGIALIWALLLSVVLIMISATVVSYTVKESGIVMNNSASSLAYANARSGIEWSSSFLATNDCPVVADREYFDLDNDSNTDVTVAMVDAGGRCSIKSTGVAGRATREINIVRAEPTKYRPSFASGVSPDGTIIDPSGPNNSGSFTMKFYFWFPSTPNGQIIGVRDSSGQLCIRFNNLSSFDLLAYDSTGNHVGTGSINYDTATDPNHSSFSQYLASVRYVKGFGANFTLEQRQADGSYEYKGSAQLDLAGHELGNLSLVKTDASAIYTTTGPESDGKYILLRNGATDTVGVNEFQVLVN